MIVNLNVYADFMTSLAKLGALDRRILGSLQQDESMSNGELAERVDGECGPVQLVGATTVFERIS